MNEELVYSQTSFSSKSEVKLTERRGSSKCYMFCTACIELKQFIFIQKSNHSIKNAKDSLFRRVRQAYRSVIGYKQTINYPFTMRNPGLPMKCPGSS